MGELRRHPATQPVAVLLGVLLVCVVAWLAVTRLPAQAQFERWLQDQPGVLTVRIDASRALGSGVQAASVPTPTATATMATPLSPTVVGGIMRAFERYATDHAEVARWTLDVVHDADVVTVYGSRGSNAHAFAVLSAVQGLPGLRSTTLSLAPWPSHLTVTLVAGSDLVAAAQTMSVARPEAPPEDADHWRSVPVTATDGPHTVVASRGGTPTAGADQAFRDAVRLEGGRRVDLALAREGDGRGSSTLTLDETSPTTARTVSALSARGFGLASRGEAITVGASGTPTFDTDAWSRSAGAGLRAVPGVLAVALHPGDEKTLPSADIRLTPTGSLTRLAKALPASVDHLEVHTALAAPDYDRDDALPVDPETMCPVGPKGSLNLAYTGPPGALAGAADYLAEVRNESSPQCLHWVEPGVGSRSDATFLVVRIPLQERAWQPVVDLVLDRRARAGSAGPGLELILPAPGHAWSAVLIARGDQDDPTTGELDAETPADLRAARTAVMPVLDYWHAHVRTG